MLVQSWDSHRPSPSWEQRPFRMGCWLPWSPEAKPGGSSPQILKSLTQGTPKCILKVMIFHWKMINTGRERERERDNIKKIPVYPQESLYSLGHHSKICVCILSRGERCAYAGVFVLSWCHVAHSGRFWKVRSTGKDGHTWSMEVCGCGRLADEGKGLMMWNWFHV